MSDERMSKWGIAQPCSQGWPFAHFAIALFFERQMSDLENRSFFAHFCSFALFERANERLLFSSFFLKERLLFLPLFWKEQKKSDRSFALLQRATKRAIAHSLFWKEQKWVMSEWANERLPSPDKNDVFSWDSFFAYMVQYTALRAAFYVALGKRYSAQHSA